jgi:hypothetical protein
VQQLKISFAYRFKLILSFLNLDRSIIVALFGANNFHLFEDFQQDEVVFTFVVGFRHSS